MTFKQFRWWLAGKIIGGEIVEEVNTAKLIEDARHEWVKQQLAHGNSVTLEYKVTHIEDAKRKKA